MYRGIQFETVNGNSTMQVIIDSCEIKNILHVVLSILIAVVYWLVIHTAITCHVISGDSAYKLDQNMMVPFRDNGNLTDSQRRYNYLHSTNRMIVENAFGLLKNKFPRVHRLLEIRDHKRAIMIIISTMLLHNFIIDNQSPKDTFIDIVPATVLPSEPIAKRNAIMNILIRQ